MSNQYKKGIIANFNLGALAANIATIYSIRKFPALRQPTKYHLPDQAKTDTPLYTGALGNPVFSDLDISNGSYIDNEGNVVNFEGMTIPTVLMTAQQTKKIVPTEVQGLDGSIKEFISEGDWRINVKGILLGKNNTYPKEDVAKLDKLLKANVALQVNSSYLTQFGIFNLVITDKHFPQAMGEYSQQVFEFNALSDIPIQLF